MRLGHDDEATSSSRHASHQHLNSLERAYRDVEIKPIAVEVCPPGTMAASCFTVKGTSLEIGVDLFLGQTGHAPWSGHENMFLKLSD